jgi:hypothetical protein
MSEEQELVEDSMTPAGLARSFAIHKTKKESVLLVPFYGGTARHLLKHVRFFNELGYDVYSLNMDLQVRNLKNALYSANSGLGFKHVWADQIENALNFIPGQKIVMAMSNPCSGAIEAVSRRQACDVTAMICEGGPTAHFWKASINYFTFEKPLPTKPLKMLMAGIGMFLWTPNWMQNLKPDLEKWPSTCPILSVRGWKDPLISPSDIDEVFALHPHLRWSKLDLPKAVHLNGLRDFADIYKAGVTKFLDGVSCFVSSSPKPDSPREK